MGGDFAFHDANFPRLSGQVRRGHTEPTTRIVPSTVMTNYGSSSASLDIRSITNIGTFEENVQSSDKFLTQHLHQAEHHAGSRKLTTFISSQSSISLPIAADKATTHPPSSHRAQITFPAEQAASLSEACRDKDLSLPVTIYTSAIAATVTANPTSPPGRYTSWEIFDMGKPASLQRPICTARPSA
ncbi:hypothetical protein BDV06DRAFT_224061 [Aspergillus oleicola]